MFRRGGTVAMHSYAPWINSPSQIHGARWLRAVIKCFPVRRAKCLRTKSANSCRGGFRLIRQKPRRDSRKNDARARVPGPGIWVAPLRSLSVAKASVALFAEFGFLDRECEGFAFALPAKKSRLLIFGS